jgi:hypothetical protein
MPRRFAGKCNRRQQGILIERAVEQWEDTPTNIGSVFMLVLKENKRHGIWEIIWET